MKKSKLISIFALGIFLFSMFGVITPANAVSNNLASQMEMHVPLTAFNVYSEYYKAQDFLAIGNTFDASPVEGFTLLEDKSELDLAQFTVESDDIILEGSTSLFDRSAYSKTMMNETFASGTESNATATTVNTEYAVSSRGTTATAQITNDAIGATNNVQWFSYLGFDQNNDGDFADAGDKGYLPLGGNEWLYLGVSSDHSSSPNAGTYGELGIVLERTTGTDYSVLIQMFPGAGDSGWSGVGGSADNQALFKAYDSDAAFLGISIPIGELITEDSSETGTILGLDIIRPKIVVAGASDSVTLTVKNIAVFNNQPALTDRSDDDEDFDWNDVGNVFAGVHDTDSNYFYTKITESTTETYDSKIALNDDLTGVVNTLVPIRYARFDGIASIQPSVTGSSISSELVSGQIYYKTTEIVTFDTTDIDPLTTFSNIFTWGDMKVNITVDDDKLPFTIDYEDNLVEFFIDWNLALGSGIDKTSTLADSLSVSTVSGSSSPKSEVQYDISNPSTTTGAVNTYKLVLYTDTSYTGAVVASTTSAGGGAVAVGSGSGLSDEMVMWIGIILAVVGLAVVVYLVRRK